MNTKWKIILAVAKAVTLANLYTNAFTYILAVAAAVAWVMGGPWGWLLLGSGVCVVLTMLTWAFCQWVVGKAHRYDAENGFAREGDEA